MLFAPIQASRELTADSCREQAGQVARAGARNTWARCQMMMHGAHGAGRAGDRVSRGFTCLLFIWHIADEVLDSYANISIRWQMLFRPVRLRARQDPGDQKSGLRGEVSVAWLALISQAGREPWRVERWGEAQLRTSRRAPGSSARWPTDSQSARCATSAPCHRRWCSAQRLVVQRKDEGLRLAGASLVRRKRWALAPRALL